VTPKGWWCHLTSLEKLTGHGPDSSVELAYPNIWQRDEQPSCSRLVIGAREREIPLILELCRTMSGPFWVLYVLTLPCVDGREGRYRSPRPVEYDVLELFLYTFQEFFERDGRHHLWVVSANDEGQFVFDDHNMVYAYGDLERYESCLESAGFTRGSVAMSSPHCHHYHREFDTAEDELLAYWRWEKFPLEPIDGP
jgi:hypothetical protein